ncbi:hypothetical protein KORDIASMS9_02402 [Kordia sp. SMS9]|nr:hypothetical protein KORDIASMS9_02402 [Kordia sp. SMS9]
MRIFNSILKNEYDLKKLKLFSEPKFYSAKGDLSMRWFVYFLYRDSKTGKAATILKHH